MKKLTDFLTEQGIYFYAPLSFDDAAVFANKLARCRLAFSPQSVWFLLVPYFSSPGENVSAYAVARDYHAWAKAFSEQLLPVLEQTVSGASFAFYCDNSPLNERKGAQAAGLGMLGDNGLLLHPLYGSYFFICEVLSDAAPALFPTSLPDALSPCLHCGACKAACPTKALVGEGDCLSAITQKKGELTPSECALICESGCVWGCDKCQSVCPINRNAKKSGTLASPIPFFSEHLIPFVTYDLIEKMPCEEFERRAYAWRKKETIMRNLKLLENAKENRNYEKE